MKHIVHPLQWDMTSWHPIWEATIPGIKLYRYRAIKFINGKFNCFFEHAAWGDDSPATVWQEREFSTIEEAKAACEKHYEKFVLSLLSLEAVESLLKQDFQTQKQQ